MKVLALSEEHSRSCPERTEGPPRRRSRSRGEEMFLELRERRGIFRREKGLHVRSNERHRRRRGRRRDVERSAEQKSASFCSAVGNSSGNSSFQSSFGSEVVETENAIANRQDSILEETMNSWCTRSSRDESDGEEEIRRSSRHDLDTSGTRVCCADSSTRSLQFPDNNFSSSTTSSAAVASSSSSSSAFSPSQVTYWRRKRRHHGSSSTLSCGKRSPMTYGRGRAIWSGRLSSPRGSGRRAPWFFFIPSLYIYWTASLVGFVHALQDYRSASRRTHASLTTPQQTSDSMKARTSGLKKRQQQLAERVASGAKSDQSELHANDVSMDLRSSIDAKIKKGNLETLDDGVDDSPKTLKAPQDRSQEGESVDPKRKPATETRTDSGKTFKHDKYQHGSINEVQVVVDNRNGGDESELLGVKTSRSSRNAKEGEKRRPNETKEHDQNKTESEKSAMSASKTEGGDNTQREELQLSEMTSQATDTSGASSLQQLQMMSGMWMRGDDEKLKCHVTVADGMDETWTKGNGCCPEVVVVKPEFTRAADKCPYHCAYQLEQEDPIGCMCRHCCGQKAAMHNDCGTTAGCRNILDGIPGVSKNDFTEDILKILHPKGEDHACKQCVGGPAYCHTKACEKLAQEALQELQNAYNAAEDYDGDPTLENVIPTTCKFSQQSKYEAGSSKCNGVDRAVHAGRGDDCKLNHAAGLHVSNQMRFMLLVTGVILYISGVSL
ncbi:unnamed protein product [Amoebophrya sp. A25]|nr:unnamed protein product [Amoebophrya sp. A25]|eukprot:GSA25T00000567001.1